MPSCDSVFALSLRLPNQKAANAIMRSPRTAPIPMPALAPDPRPELVGWAGSDPEVADRAGLFVEVVGPVVALEGFWVDMTCWDIENEVDEPRSGAAEIDDGEEEDN